MNIVITGGSKGMGKSIAGKFSAAGNQVFIVSRNRQELGKTAEEIQSATGNPVSFFATDLSQRKGVSQFADWLGGQGIVPDVLVNNAGQFLPGSIYDEKEGTLEEMISVNLLSAYHLTRALLPYMMERKSGHIFNMSSIAALSAYRNGGSYSISKFAIMGFSKNLREEMKPFNIKVTTVYPGAVFTSSWEGAGILPSRIMEVEDVSSMILAASQLSPQACVEDIVMRPLLGDIP